MKTKELLLNIAIMFVIVLVVAVIVTYLWNLVAHETGSVDWDISLVLAISMGIALPLSLALRVEEK